MKFCFLYTFLVFSLLVKAQDKLFLLDGSKKFAKILEVGIEDVIYTELSESGAPFTNDRLVISKNKILLIEYKGGFVEIFNRPEKNSVITEQGLVNTQVKKANDTSTNSNLLYLNTLALCNADLALFYEHILPNRKVGLGIMAAYNFNQYATNPNTFIYILNNGKKLYDVGGFINYYPKVFNKRKIFFYGLMLKYTALSFSKNTGTSTSVIYSPASGGQLATLINFGSQRFLSKNLFLKTEVAFGGFFLKGDYEVEFNQILSSSSPGDPVTYSFLPKLYIGLNLGFFL